MGRSLTVRFRNKPSNSSWIISVKKEDAEDARWKTIGTTHTLSQPLVLHATHLESDKYEILFT